ncbi:uncharacterized protein LOC126899176 [Daktulosphaira vitifoliae]|uniref:uncharacterized protein LOC126899176 n=1 Tax=Daktulosphaira vitifoliae TaxID=58002 RepID=UPI0021AAA6DB|nr:uncharacterized protein LOC126899176 [Daktulosphaira vitifoliae]
MEKVLSNVGLNDKEECNNDVKQKMEKLEKKIDAMQAEINHLKFVFWKMINRKPIQQNKPEDSNENSLRSSIVNDKSVQSNPLKTNNVDSESDRPSPVAKLESSFKIPTKKEEKQIYKK